MIFLSILIFILAMSLRFFKTQITPIFFTRIASLVFIYAGVLTFNALYIQSIGSGIGIYSGLFQVNYYNMLFETFLYGTGAIILLSWPLLYRVANVYPIDKQRNVKFSLSAIVDNNTLNSFYMKESSLNITEDINIPAGAEPDPHSKSNKINKTNTGANTGEAFGLITSVTTATEAREYSLIALFSSLGGSLLLSSGDLLSMYLSIELQSFGLYILATIYRESGSATSAGLKYFLLGGLSSCLILLGLALVYSFTGITSFESLYSLISVLSISENSVLGLNSLVTDIDPLTLSSLSYTSNTGSGSAAVSLINTSTFYLWDDTENISKGLSLGLIFIAVGFLFKIAGAPFHNWAPDVYDESPTNITIWLTIMPKLSIILLLLELEMGISFNLFQPLMVDNSGVVAEPSTLLSIFDSYLQFNINNSEGWGGATHNILKNIFLLSSLLSLIIGTVVGLAQIRIKRLLAYSTVSHIGFLLLALAISTEQSTESLIFYLIQYTLTNLNAFFILLAFGYIINSLISSSYTNTEIKFIFNLKGQFLANPILSLSLAVCLFSMAGIPPLIGFFGKQSVLFAAIGNGYLFMSFVAIIVSVISASYYLRIIRELYSDNENKEYNKDSISQSDLSYPNILSAIPKEYSSIEKLLSVSIFNINAERDASSINYPNTTNNKIKILEDIETQSIIKNGNVLRNGIGSSGSAPLLKIEARSPSPFGATPAFGKGSGYSPNFNLFVSSSNNAYLNLTNTHSFIIASLTLSIIFYVLKPSIILNSAVLSTLSLFYF